MGKKLLFLHILLLCCMFSPSEIHAQCSEPTSISITNNSGSSVCEDETISFSSTVNPTNPSVAYTYQWQVQLNGGTWTDISGATNADLNNYDAAIGNNKFRLQVTSCGGTTDEEENNSPISSTIIVYENKTGTVSISSNKTNICPGEQINFTSSPTNHGGSGATYEWRLLNDNSLLSNSASFSSTEIPDGGQVQLFMTSSVPCVDPFQSTILTITHKDGIPSQPATISLDTETDLKICPNTSATFSVTNDPKATSYIWNLPSGWTGSSSTNSINITTGGASASSQTISVKAVNECGGSSFQTLDVTVGPGKPATPSSIQLTDEDNDGIICPGELITLSVTNDPEVDEYNWTLPSGWSGTSTTNSIQVSGIEFGEDGTVSVYSFNECLDSEPQTLELSVNTPVPAEPSIDGPVLVCSGIDADYSITDVEYADSYEWFLDGNLLTGVTGTSYNFSSTNVGDHDLEVRAVNECGYSSSNLFTVTVDDGVPDPVTITNSNSENSFCEDASGLVFSVAADTKADTYNWTVPSGWSITSGENTNSIIVTAGSFGEDGNISVTAISDDGCGDVSDSFAVSIKNPAPVLTGEITGPASVCSNATNLTYQVPAADYATSYTWTLPDGWAGSSNSNSISVDAAALTGTGEISVIANNDCGPSSTQTFEVTTTNSAPEIPGTITSTDNAFNSNPNACPPASNLEFTVPVVSGASTYEWQMPSGWSIISGEGTNTVTINISAAGNYSSTENLRVRAGNGCYWSEYSQPFVINIDDYILTDMGPDLTVCENTSGAITLNAQVVFGNSNFKASDITFTNSTDGTNRGFASLGSGNVSGSFNVNYTPNQADKDAGQVTLTMNVPKPKGNNSSCGTGQDSMTIFFKDLPTASISENSEICYNTSTTLDISGTPNTTLTYSNGTATSTVNVDDSGSAIINTGNLTTTTTYTLQSIAYTNGPGCSQTLSGSSTVTVNPIPSAVLTYSDAPFCNSENGTYTPTFSEGVGIYQGGTFSASGITVNATDGSFSPAGVAAGTYTITYNFDDPLDCGYEPITTEVSIYDAVSIDTQPEGIRICEGDAINLSVVASGDGLSYQWYKGSEPGTEISGANSATLNIPTSSIDAEGIYYVMVGGTAPCSDLKSDEVEVLIDEEIEITDLSSNVPDNEICEGGAVTFSVTAAAGDEVLTYQWYDNNGEAISGATGNTYELTGASLENSGDYYVEIGGSTDYNCSTVTSENISIIINETPNADISYTGPYCSSDSEIKSVSYNNTGGNYTGGSFSFSVESGGSNLAIDSTTGDINPSASDPGVYNISYTIPASGGCSEVIETTQVTITEAPSATIAFTDDVTEFCNDDTQGTLTPTLTGSGNYTGGSFAGVPGIVSGTGEINFEGLAAGNYTITYTIPPSEGCSDNVATLDITVYESVKITSEPFPVAVCSANNTQLEVAATGANLSYQWFKDGNLINGATSAIYQINSASVTEDAGSYHVEVSGENACKTITSETVTVTVDENIIIDTQPQPQDICIGGEINLSVAATASGGDPIYQWRKDGVDISGANSATLSIPNAQLSDSGEYDVVIDGPDGYACDLGYSEKVLVTVNEAATVEAGEPINACSTDGTVAIGSDGSATNYSSLVWTSSGTGTFEDANALITNYIPGTGETGEVTLTLTVQGNAGCSEVSDAVTVNISNLPVINSFAYSTTEFCVSIDTPQPPSLDLSNATVGDGIFSYTGETGNTLDLNTATGNINPSSSTPGTYMITFEIPSDGICEAVSATSEITITPLPTANFSYTESPFCSNSENPTPTMETGAEKGSFSSTTGLVFVNANTGEIDLASSEPGTYSVINTIAAAGGCDEVTASTEVTITKLPIAEFSYQDTPYCSNDPNPVVTLEAEAQHGVYTSTDGLVFSDNTTGEIDLANSTPGTYTVTNTIVAANGCEEVVATAEISITKLPVANFTYANLNDENAVCISQMGLSIGEQPDPNGTYSSSSLNSFLDVNTGEISWGITSQIPIGAHTVTYTIPASEGCPEVSYSETIRVDALPEGGALAWDNNERIFLTCEVQTNTLNEVLSLSGKIGEIAEWEYRTVSSGVWQTYNSQSSSINRDDFESILGGSVESTVFRVRVVNGACDDPDNPVYSQTAILSVIPDDIKPSPVESDPDVLCYNELVTLSSETGYGSEAGKFEGGAFDQAGLDNNGSGWNFTNPDGTSFNFEGSVNNGRSSTWGRMNPHGNDPPNEKVYNSNIPADGFGEMINYRTYSGNAGNKGFALVTGDSDSRMETPPFSLTGVDEAILTWDQAYNLTEGAVIMVEISRDGGATYPLDYPIPDVEDINFAAQDIIYFNIGDGTEATGSSGNFDHFGEGTPGINQMSIDLGDYLGETNLRVRFTFIGTIDGDVWAVDNIKVPDGPQDVQLIWYYDHSPEVGSFDPNDPDIEQIGEVNQTTVTYPQNGNAWPKLGWNDFEVRTALILDSNGDPCESINNFETIQVFVFDKYTSTITANAGECGNTRVQLSATVIGDFQGDVTAGLVVDSEARTTVDGYQGTWEITGDGPYTLMNPDGTISNPDPIHNPNAIFEADGLGNFSFSYVMTPTAVYPDNFKDETLRGQLVENLGCPPESNIVDVQIPECTTLDFDGVDDFVFINDDYDEAKAFETWFRPESENGPGSGKVATIFSSENVELFINAGNALVLIYNGKRYTSSESIELDKRWYHIAVTLGTTIKMYIDGIEMNISNAPSSGELATGGNFIIGAGYTGEFSEPDNYFSGWIEDFRIWKKEITEEQIHFLMNQHLVPNGARMGEIIPLDVPGGLTYSDLAGYYRLISAEPNIGNPEPENYAANLYPNNGETPDLATNSIPGILNNMTTHQKNTAPQPYYSFKNGDWMDDIDTDGTWLRPEVWDPPNSRGIDGTLINWNIAVISHNIDSGNIESGRITDPFDEKEEYALTLLGLLSEQGLLRMATPGGPQDENNSGQHLRITHYLDLDGNIDLVGESQLVQDQGSVLDEDSGGWLERDQQGTRSSYNYNYWSSPVSAQGAANNADYSIGGVLWDGTDSTNPKAINYQGAYHAADHGARTNPITLSTYWMWRFRGTADVYGEWKWVAQSGTLKTGEGYTMKGTSGTATVTDLQNYVYKGKPHNGDFTRPIATNMNYLLGNPYPSAMDANTFILDNLASPTGNNTQNVFNGVLYFWDHFAGQTHYLAEYVGGYAAYSLAGGVPGVALDPRVNNNNQSGTKTPSRFIPVAQGFFLLTNGDTNDGVDDYNAQSGDVVFRNWQRVGIKEGIVYSVEPPSKEDPSVFLKPEYPSKDKDKVSNNKDQNNTNKDSRTKIRLKFRSPKKYHRQILVTKDKNTSDGYDIGYDAPLADDNVEDMYWLIGERKYVIQAVPDFNNERILPLGIKIDEEGEFKFQIDSVQNWPEGKMLYIKDKQLDSIHDILDEPYKASAEKGILHDRFELVFQKEKDDIVEPEDPEDPSDPIVDGPDKEDPTKELPEIDGLVGISYSTFSHQVKIANYDLLDIQKVQIFSMNGQLIQEFEGLPTQKEINLGMRPVRTGVYIVKAICENGVCNKKIIVR